MLKGYVIAAYRNIVRNKTYSIVNIIGLAVGMACCMLISLWIADELSYDRFNVHADRVYRVLRERENMELKTGGPLDSYVAPGYSSAFRENVPEVELSTRYMRAYQEILINRDEIKFYIRDLAFADEDFFRMFSYPFLKGNPKTALKEPQSIVLTDRLARSYFEDENPVGQTVTFLDTIFTVTGVIEDLPSNSHIQFSCIGRLKDIGTPDDNWNRNWYRTYVLLGENASPSATEEIMNSVVEKSGGEGACVIKLQPLKDIRLRSEGIRDQIRGDIKQLHIFGAIGILIILIACVNFVNLTTARAVNRAREVGVRKVVGARRTSLIRQFFVETLCIALIAAASAYVMVELSLPLFNNLTGKQLDLNDYGIWKVLIAVAILVLLTSILAGAYPASLLSAFKPVRVLQATSFVGGRGFTLRRVLVVSQFALTLILLLCTLTVYRQYYYMRNTDLGCNLRNIVYVKKDGVMWDKLEPLKQELLATPGVEGITSISRVLPLGSYMQTYADWEGRDPDGELLWTHQAISDPDFLTLFDIELIQGRNFKEMYPEEPLTEVIVNEAFVRGAGLENPLGKWTSCHLWDHQKRRIIGVVKDFHFSSLHSKIPPMIISCDPYSCRYLAVKIQSDDVQSTLASIGTVIQQIEPGIPFDYAFLYDKFDVFYSKERHLGILVGAFSGLAVFLACLGLLGLVAFMTQRRIREIGIRKALGASVANIVGLLSREFLILVAVANIIAWPIGYFIMSHWLKNFAYRTDLGWYIFLLVSGLALLIALVTVSIPAVRAALANPANALHHE